MFFPQNGADYDPERLKGIADRAAERAMQDLEILSLPKEKRIKAFLSRHIGLVVLLTIAGILLLISLIAGK